MNYEHFMLNKVALPIIRKAGKNSGYVRHYKGEREFAYKGKKIDEMDAFMDQQVCDLLSLLSTQGDSGFSIGFKRHLFDKGASFALLSPLTFTDDEFGSRLGFDESMQNKRLSAIFKDVEGRIYDIDAFIHRHKYTYNIDTDELTKGTDLTWSGCVMLYDDVNHTGWIVFTKGYIDPANKHFTGSNRVVVPSIEVIDNNCGRGTFIMNLSKMSAIPKEFFKDYTIISAKGKHFEENMELINARENDFLKVLGNL